jgi:hypothetical protein
MRWQFSVALVAIGVVYPAAAQVRPPHLAAQLKQKQQLKQQQKLKQQLQPLPGPDVQRFLRMSPEERQRALAQLPPERRQQIEENVGRLERLSPEQRAQLERRYQIFEKLPPGRRALVREAIMRLRAMPPAQRKAVLESDDAKLRFNPEEIRLLRDVVGLPEEE